MEHIERAGVHSGDSACSLPPYSIDAEVQDEIRRQTVALARELRRRRPDERAVRRQGPGGLRARGEPARVAARCRSCRKAIGVPLAKIAARVHGRARRSRDLGFTSEIVPDARERQGGGLPVHQVPGRRHGARSRDEVDGRGDGHRRDVRRRLRQGADRAPARCCRTSGSGLRLGAAGRGQGGLVADRAAARARAASGWSPPSGTAARLRSRRARRSTIVNKVQQGSPHIVDALRARRGRARDQHAGGQRSRTATRSRSAARRSSAGCRTSRRSPRPRRRPRASRPWRAGR